MSLLRLVVAAAIVQVVSPAHAVESGSRVEVRAARIEIASDDRSKRIALNARISLATPQPAPGMAVDARAKLVNGTCSVAVDALFAHGFEG